MQAINSAAEAACTKGLNKPNIAPPEFGPDMKAETGNFTHCVSRPAILPETAAE
jgi:hypothetical protein